MVAGYEAAPHGEKSAVLRREGLFHSHVREWTRARGAGVTPANTNGSVNTSATTARLSRAKRETERLRAENARLHAKPLADAGSVVDHGEATAPAGSAGPRHRRAGRGPAGDQPGRLRRVVDRTHLDPGTRRNRYWCSLSSMYRIAAAAGQTRERRRQATHPAKVKPELVADAPSQVWTWDRGTSMTSQPVSALLVNLGVTRAHSRPRISDDKSVSPKRGSRP